jgi:hypothetical protein
MICIPLTQGQHAIIDNDDFEFVAQYKWFAIKHRYTFYARAKINGRAIPMHRLILGIIDTPQICDHIDGNGINNTRSNLRLCSSQQNSLNRRKRSDNSTGFKGVRFRKSRNKFIAVISFAGKQRMIGSFNTPEEAHAAYCAAAVKYHGEFANTGL